MAGAVDIETIGVEFQTDGLVKGQAALKATAQEANKMADAVDKVGDASKSTSQKMSALDQAAARSRSGMEQAQRQVNQFIAALERQNATFGKSASQIAAYDSTMLAASRTQREYIDLLLKQAAANEAAAASQNKHIASTDALRMGYYALRAGIVTFMSIAIVKQFLEMADSMTMLDSRLRMVTTSSYQAAAAKDQLYQIAQRTHVAFTELGNTYAQMARATQDLGINQTRLLGVTETLSKTIALSGSSAAATQAALIQLSQGLASGALRGDELNSVMEQMPALARAIAQGMGISIGQLRAMGKEGEITSETIIMALEKVRESVDKEFKSMTVTVGQSSTNMSNAIVRLVGEIDKLTGASAAAAARIQFLSNVLDKGADMIKGWRDRWDLFTLAGELQVMNNRVVQLQANIRRGSASPQDVSELNELLVKLDKAKEKFRQLDAAARGGSANSSQSTFRQSEISDQQRGIVALGKAMTDVEDIRRRALGVNDKYLEDLKKLQNAYRTGAIPTEQEYVNLVSDLAKRTFEASTAGKEHAKAVSDAKQVSAEHNKVLAESVGLQADFYKDWNALNDLYKSGVIPTVDMLSAAQAKLLAQQPFFKEYWKQQEEDGKALIAVWHQLEAEEKAAFDQMEKQFEAVDKQNNSYEQQLRNLREQAATYGLTKTQIADVEAARLLETAAQKEQIAATMDNIDWTGKMGDVYREQAKLLRDLAEQKRLNASHEMRVDDAKKLMDDIDSTFRDGFSHLLKHEEGEWASFTKSLADTFKTEVADAIYKMFVRPIIVNLVGSFLGVSPGAMGNGGGGVSIISKLLGGGGGGGGVSSVGGPGGFMNSGLMNNLGYLGAGYQALTGSFTGASTASLAYANAVGAMGGDSLGALIAANGGWAGVGVGAAGAAGAGLGAGAATGADLALFYGGAEALGAAGAGAGAGAAAGAAGAGAGLGTTAAAVIPVVGWVIAIAGLLYSIFGKKGGGPKVSGGYLSSGFGFPSDHDAGSDNTARQLAQGVQGQYDALVSAFGGSSQLQYGAGFSADPRGTAPTFLDFTGQRNGQDAFRIANDSVGRSQEDFQRAVQEQGAKAILAGLQQSNLSGKLAVYLANLGNVANMAGDAAVATVARLQTAMSQRAALEEQLFQMTATAEEKAAKARQKELDAVDEFNRDLLREVQAMQDVQQAKSDLVAAYQTEGTAIAQSIQGHRNFALQVREYLKTLALSPTSTLGLSARTGYAASLFQSSLASVRAGKDANVTGTASDYLNSLMASAHTAAEFRIGFANTAAELNKLAQEQEDQATIEEQQLKAMEEQLKALGLLNENTTTFQSALANYFAKQSAYEALKASNAAQAEVDRLQALAIAAQRAAEEAAAAAAEAERQRQQAQTANDYWNNYGGGGPGGGDGSAGSASSDGGSDGSAGAAGYAVGTNYVPYDMMTTVHEGERIVPKRDNPYANPYTSDATTAVSVLQATQADQKRALDALCAKTAQMVTILKELQIRGVQIRDADSGIIPSVHVV